MTDSNNPWLTQESYDKLKSELDALYEHRPIIAAEINERREEGDLKENAGYDAAREMQDQEEARIKQISELLANSTTEREGVVEGVALVGSVVFFALALWFVVAAPTGSVGTDDGGLASPPAWSIVAVLGAGGGIGQPLSLLLKLDPHVSALSLYDIRGAPGVAADVSHIDTSSPVRPCLPPSASAARACAETGRVRRCTATRRTSSTRRSRAPRSSSSPPGYGGTRGTKYEVSVFQ